MSYRVLSSISRAHFASLTADRKGHQVKPITWIYNFQTLIAGALALGGAVVTICGIWHQVRQSQRQEDERPPPKSGGRAP